MDRITYIIKQKTIMKKKITLYSLMIIMFSLISFSCSSDDKDDDTNIKPSGTPSATVAGAYIGTYGKDDFNKILLVEDLGNNTIRLSGNDKTPVELKVQFISGSNAVMHANLEPAGILAYDPSTGNLTFGGKQIQENQKLISFSGKRQK